jgi:uncharacterized membrane protein HdeD (DUF308 family)
MHPPRDPSVYAERAILLFLLALFVLVSPLKAFWATAVLPWYTPYLIWGGIILLAFRLRGRHDHEV